MKINRWLATTALTVAALGPVSAAAQEDADNAELAARVKALEATVAELKAQLAAQGPAASTPSRPAAPVTSDTNQPVTGGVTGFAQAKPPASSPATQAPTKADDHLAQASVYEGTGKSPEGFRIGPQTFKISGYIKGQAIYSDYSAGNPAASSSVSESLSPGLIPVGGESSNETHFDARQSRFALTSSGIIADHKVGSMLEIDLFGGSIDARTTNGAGLRLRRAFLTFDNWLIGQEWTNFQDTAAFPESGNFVGPSAATILVRQAQLRYTNGPLSISIENPETTYSPFNATGRVTTGDTVMPDITARYDVKRAGGFLSIAGIVRQLRSDTPLVRDTTYGWGLSASGKIPTFGQDDLRFQVNGGRGIGRYLLNFANDAALDADGDLHAVPLIAGFVAYRHFWADRLRSSLVLEGQRVYNDREYAALDANRAAYGGQLNIVYSPFSNLDLGFEYIFMQRELENGQEGHVNRGIAFAKFGF